MEIKKYWAAFLAAENIGRQTFKLISQFSLSKQVSLSHLWLKPSILLANQIITQRKLDGIIDFQKKYSADSYLEYLALKNININTIEDACYPQLLKQIQDPPLLFYTKGINLFESKLIDRTIAVVGTRRITSYGKMVTNKIVAQLVGLKTMIISGCMYGVDMTAHNQALDSQGLTIGVTGFGFEHCYPASAKSFFDQFLQRGGMLVSEFAPFVEPIPGNFPTRNRIVAGLSRGVLVTEAAMKSGSHITAMSAIDNGRSVYSVPGPITNPYCEGTKWLINQGAMMISSGQEIIEDLRFNFDPLKAQGQAILKGNNDLQDKIIKLLQVNSLSTDQLSKQLRVEISQLSVELSQLEVIGLISRQGESWLLA